MLVLIFIVCEYTVVDFFVFSVFDILFYVGTHLARGYSSGDPRKHTQHNYKQSQTIKLYLYTHCVVSGSTFFKSFRGAGLGLNPENPITLAQHHH